MGARVEESLTRRSLPVVLTLHFWAPLLSLGLLLAWFQTTASQVHPAGPIALVGVQVLDGSEVAPISDGVVIYEDGVIINGCLYDGDTLDQKRPDRVPLPDFWWWDEDDIRFSANPVSLGTE